MGETPKKMQVEASFLVSVSLALEILQFIPIAIPIIHTPNGSNGLLWEVYWDIQLENCF